MIDKETMIILGELAEELHKLKTEENDAIIFLALSEESKSVTCVINGNESSVEASLAFLIDKVFKDTPSENKKRMKWFLLTQILQK